MGDIDREEREEGTTPMYSYTLPNCFSSHSSLQVARLH